MRDLSDVVDFLNQQASLRALLTHVAALDLRDCYLAAGVLRNALWDALHERKPSFDALEDVDVIYFDPVASEAARDRVLERRLAASKPDAPWSVKNQARMHHRNGDAPYESCLEAMSHWPETATAIAARLRDGALEVVAPYGVDDLLALHVRPTPTFLHKLDVYRRRILDKRWAERWPRLTFARV